MRLKKDGMFTGVEREGVLSGVPTLFVQGSSQRWADIELTLQRTQLRHLELGSGRQLHWNDELLSAALASDLLDYVTVETYAIDGLHAAGHLSNEKLHVFVALLMPEAHTPTPHLHTVDNPLLLSEFTRNHRVMLKLATPVHVMVMNCKGMLSFNRNDIFFADQPL